VGNLITLVVLISLFTGCMACTSGSEHEHKSINDATNKELQQFHQWEQKQNQQKWENEKPFK
jgi:flagellar basal body L-ring protein FlgH